MLKRFESFAGAQLDRAVLVGLGTTLFFMVFLRHPGLGEILDEGGEPLGNHILGSYWENGKLNGNYRDYRTYIGDYRGYIEVILGYWKRKWKLL